MSLIMIYNNLYQVKAILPDGRTITRNIIPMGILTDSDKERLEVFVEGVIESAAISISNESDFLGFVTLEGDAKKE